MNNPINYWYQKYLKEKQKNEGVGRPVISDKELLDRAVVYSVGVRLVYAAHPRDVDGVAVHILHAVAVLAFWPDIRNRSVGGHDVVVARPRPLLLLIEEIEQPLRCHRLASCRAMHEDVGNLSGCLDVRNTESLPSLCTNDTVSRQPVLQLELHYRFFGVHSKHTVDCQPEQLLQLFHLLPFGAFPQGCHLHLLSFIVSTLSGRLDLFIGSTALYL